MRALIQRVSQASVTVDENLVSEIKYGLLILMVAIIVHLPVGRMVIVNLVGLQMVNR